MSVMCAFKVLEPAADLAILLSIISSLRDKPLNASLAVFGEVGLTGEIRPVQRGLDRVKEVEKLGFEYLIMPKANSAGIKSGKLKIHTVSTLYEALTIAFDL